MITKCKGSNRFIALKLNMSKAYNRIEWKFLEAVLLKMGFNSRWVDLIMACLSSITYSILINGQAQPFFKPSKGIRQGDPLSLYLLIFCVESLSHLLTKTKMEGNITSLVIGNGPIRVNHLFFANDYLFFWKSNSLKWSRLVHLLELYNMLLDSF